MLKYKGYTIAFQEVPNEISLIINVAGCPHHCPGCHSQYLWDDDGAQPLLKNIETLIKPYANLITCVCFMGGDWNLFELKECLLWINNNYPTLKTCLYSGEDNIKFFNQILPLLDYIKIGSYQENKGGLNNPNTNQKFYKITKHQLEDVTYLFWRKEND